MPTRARIALTGAAGGVIAMAIIWFAAHHVGVLQRVDASVLNGFEALRRPRIDRLANAIANLCDPVPYVLFAAVPVVVALLRGRPRIALAVFVILLGANETTEVLKPLLAGPHDPVFPIMPSEVSWPSGHATASMSLALTMVIAAPARRRPIVGGVMAAFVVAVCFSFLVLGWHYPSDVLGGFLVAGTWTLLAVAVLDLIAVRHPERVRTRALPAPRASGGAVRSVVPAIVPAVVMLGAAAVLAALLAAARPHEVHQFVADHGVFVVGAAVIALLSFAFASALSVMLRAER